MKKKPKILIVDDNPINLNVLSATLSHKNYDIVSAESGEICLEILKHASVDLILLDIMMPGLDGWETCRRIKENPSTKDIPILFISALNEQEHKFKGFNAGAVDYIIRPFDGLEVNARVKTHMLLKTVQDELQNQNKILDQKVKIRTAKLEKVNHKLKREIVAHKQTHAVLRLSEKKIRAILNHMPDLVIQVDKEGIILNHNEVAKYFPFYHDHLKGNKIDQLLPPKAANMLMSHIRKVLESGESETCDCRFSRHNRSRDFEFRLTEISRDQILIIIRDITGKKRAEEALRKRETHLREENLRLKSSLKERYRLGDIIGKSQPMQRVYDLILQAAQTVAGVVIFGESGTGKELVARAIHDLSNRSAREFVPVNSGAIPENLLESEFFGFKKGAFTGAMKDTPGYFDIAAGGTLFLDEIGEIPLKMQIKLLRAIEGGGFTPVGGNHVKKNDVRIVAATHKDLKELVSEGLMREDFFYRINVIPIHVPPLRERKDDLPLLIDHFLKILAKHSKKAPRIVGNTFDAFYHHDWPGNVRELQNSIQRYATLSKIDFTESVLSDTKEQDNMPDSENFRNGLDYRTAMANYEKKLLIWALEKNCWHREKTAKFLSIPRRTFFSRLKTLELILALIVLNSALYQYLY